jgi:hypothetical protein
MKAKALSLLTGIVLLGSAGMASAAEPVTLDEKQMDSVTAGGGIVVIPAATVVAVGAATAGSAGNIIFIY